MKRFLFASLVFFTTLGLASEQRLIVHEWGTFTFFQDEQGKAIGGLNNEDEPLPDFVHNIQLELIESPLEKGIPRCHPFVTMRLETPVMYFYPPAQSALPRTLDVSVALKGGWLTQFYPQAQSDNGGLNDSRGKYLGKLSADSVGKLSWSALNVGGDWPVPPTKMNVWTAPREVRSAPVQMKLSSGKTEADKFLFYRGVAHVDSPLRVVRVNDQLELHGYLTPALESGPTLLISSGWLADIRSDQTCAYKAIPGFSVSREPGDALATVPASFPAQAYSKENLDALKKEMHQALVADGLYPDEATAMLNTWQRSYFKSAGLRLFFVAPKEWTENYLPLTISESAVISRTMIGRIELVKPEERAIVEQIAAIAGSDRNSDESRYKLFGELGRFRNALILEELQKKPSPSFASFIHRSGLEPMPIRK